MHHVLLLLVSVLLLVSTLDGAQLRNTKEKSKRKRLPSHDQQPNKVHFGYRQRKGADDEMVKNDIFINNNDSTERGGINAVNLGDIEDMLSNFDSSASSLGPHAEDPIIALQAFPRMSFLPKEERPVTLLIHHRFEHEIDWRHVFEVQGAETFFQNVKTVLSEIGNLNPIYQVPLYSRILHRLDFMDIKSVWQTIFGKIPFLLEYLCQLLEDQTNTGILVAFNPEDQSNKDIIHLFLDDTSTNIEKALLLEVLMTNFISKGRESSISKFIALVLLTWEMPGKSLSPQILGHLMGKFYDHLRTDSFERGLAAYVVASRIIMASDQTDVLESALAICLSADKSQVLLECMTPLQFSSFGHSPLLSRAPVAFWQKIWQNGSLSRPVKASTLVNLNIDVAHQYPPESLALILDLASADFSRIIPHLPANAFSAVAGSIGEANAAAITGTQLATYSPQGYRHLPLYAVSTAAIVFVTPEILASYLSQPSARSLGGSWSSIPVHIFANGIPPGYYVNMIAFHIHSERHLMPIDLWNSFLATPELGNAIQIAIESCNDVSIAD